MKSLLARIALVLIYGVSYLLIRLLRLVPRLSWQPRGAMVVTGTFYNPNWFISHGSPLANCGIEEVVFVTDVPRNEVPGITFVCPPAWLQSIVGRNVSKLIYLLIAAFRYRPDCYVGYHLFPGALMALLVAALMNRPAVYQMCAGPIEVIGGGHLTENPLLTALGGHSEMADRLARRVTREFELVAVRGSSAKQFVESLPLEPEQVTIIPGSIDVTYVGGSAERSVDVVFVGRLAEIKRPMLMLQALNEAAGKLPEIRVQLVGTGPMEDEMLAYVREHGIEKNIEFLGQRSDVEAILGQSRIFLLTSRNEGLSIAMAEAMASGCVPVVSDVGDLADLVDEGNNGYLVDTDNPADFADRIRLLLSDPAMLKEFSARASTAARNYNGRDVVSGIWEREIKAAVERHRR